MGFDDNCGNASEERPSRWTVGLVGLAVIGLIGITAAGAVAAGDAGMGASVDAGTDGNFGSETSVDGGHDAGAGPGRADETTRADVGVTDAKASIGAREGGEDHDGRMRDVAARDASMDDNPDGTAQRADKTDQTSATSGNQGGGDAGSAAARSVSRDASGADNNKKARGKQKKGSPTLDPDSIDEGPEPVRPWVLTLSAPHLVLAAISSESGRYWPMLEVTFEMQQAPRLSVAPIAGGMLVTTNFGTSGVLTAGAQGRAYMTDTFNTGLYGAGEVLVTSAIGTGSNDPTLGVPFIYSGVSPSLMLGMKLNPGRGFILDAQVGLGARYLLADQFSAFDVDVAPRLDLTVNVNLGWGFPRKTKK